MTTATTPVKIEDSSVSLIFSNSVQSLTLEELIEVQSDVRKILGDLPQVDPKIAAGYPHSSPSWLRIYVDKRFGSGRTGFDYRAELNARISDEDFDRMSTSEVRSVTFGSKSYFYGSLRRT